MKTIIILLACIACLVGCNDMPTNEYIKKNYEVVVIDSCEYIYLNQNIEGFSHKGNCKYCRERNKTTYFGITGTGGKTSDQSLSAPAGSVKLGGTLTPNTTIDPKSFKRNWTDASKAERDTMVIHYY